MDEKKLISEYKAVFDDIHASDSLRETVRDIKPSRHKIHVITPFKAAIGTVAAAVMIFAAVHEYSFDTDTSGVISETIVPSQMPQTEFIAIDTQTQTPEIEPENTIAPTATLKPKVSAKPKPAVTSNPQTTEVPVSPKETPQSEIAPQSDELTVAVARIDNHHAEEEVSVTESEPFETALSGTVIPTESGFIGYKISGGIYYTVEGTDEGAVLEKVNSL